MKIKRKEYEEMQKKLEILLDLYECYKIDREIFSLEHKCLRIAESLLTEDQRWEYYRLQGECNKYEETV